MIADYYKTYNSNVFWDANLRGLATADVVIS